MNTEQFKIVVDCLYDLEAIGWVIVGILLTIWICMFDLRGKK
jgi:hypothetical protein